MAMFLETVDGGEIETGFWGPDTTKVQLGELSPITTSQFAGYASLVMTEIVPALDVEVRQQFAVDVPRVRARIEDIPTLDFNGQFIARGIGELASQMSSVSGKERGELMASFSAAAAPTDNAVYYRENPFTIQSDAQQVKIEDADGTSHTITAEDFMHLVFRIMRGGMAGWNQYGTYQEIKALALHFDMLLSEEADSPQNPSD